MQTSGPNLICHAVPSPFEKPNLVPGEQRTRVSLIVHNQFTNNVFAMELQNILLIGGTGTIGTTIRKALVSHKSNFNKIGVLTTAASLSDVKKKESFENVQREGVQIVTADLEDHNTLTQALKGTSWCSCLTIRVGCSYLCSGARSSSKTESNYWRSCWSRRISFHSEWIWFRPQHPIQFPATCVQNQGFYWKASPRDRIQEPFFFVYSHFKWWYIYEQMC